MNHSIGSMKILKNPSVLTADYIPETIVGREEYVNLIDGMIKRDDLSSTFIIRGNPGTGKTVIGRHLIQKNREYRGVYVNCYIHPTDKAIVSEILGKDSLRNLEPTSMGQDKLSRILFDSLPERNNLIVLDEAHSLKRGHGQILYLLSRSGELGGPIMKLILLTMEEPEFFLDRSTLSGLGKYNRISLKEYDSEELYMILMQRAEKAFYEGSFDETSIESCAQLTEENGNARDAIELMKNSALLAEAKNEFLSEEIVVEAYRDFSPPLEDSSLVNLEEDEIRLLRKLIQQTGSETKFRSSELKLIDDSISDSRIYRFLRILENSGLIKKNKIGKGYGGGVENEYFFRIPSFLLLEKLSSVENSISKEKV